MATVDQLIIEILARDNGAEETLEKLHTRLGELLNEAQRSSKKTMDTASSAAKKAGDEMERVGQKAEEANKKIAESGKKSIDVFSRMRGMALRFLGVFALFSFGKKIVGDAMQSAVALGNLSRASGVARQDLEALGNTYAALGQSKEGADRLAGELAQARADVLSGKGASNEFLRKFSLANVNVFQKNGELRNDLPGMLLEAGDYFKKMAKGDEQQAMRLARSRGFSEEEVQVMIRGTRELYKEKRELIKTTDEEYRQQEEAARRWEETKQKLEQLGKQIATRLLPIIETLTEWFANFLEEISKDPEKLNELIVLFGALAVAIGLIFNPIGTAIGLFVGLMGVLYKVTNRFEFVRKTWDGMVLAIKSGINELGGALAKFLRWIGMDELADKVESFKFDTSSEESSVNSPTKAEAEGEGNPTQYESTGETLPDYSGRSQEALGKKIKSKKPNTEVASAIQNAAQKTGLSEDLLFGIAHQESGFNARAGAGTSSAKGLFQFTSSSWRAMVDKYGKKYGLTYDGVYDPRQNALAGALYMKEHERAFRKAGIEVSGASLYMGNFLGTGGAKKFFQELKKNPNASMASIWLASSNQNIRNQVAPNKSIFYTNNGKGRARSLQEVYDFMRSKSTWSGGASGSLVATSRSVPVSSNRRETVRQNVIRQTSPEDYSVARNFKVAGWHPTERLLDESAVKTYAKKVGTRYALDGVNDCSAYCRQLLKDAIQNNPDKFEKGLVKDVTKGWTAAGIIQNLEKRAGGLLGRNELDPSRIKSGTVIGMDTGERGWEKGRYKGIDHIVYTYRDPRTGKMMVTQSARWNYNSNRRDGVGVQTMEYDKWYRMRSQQKAKLYGVSMTSLAKPEAYDTRQPSIQPQRQPVPQRPQPQVQQPQIQQPQIQQPEQPPVQQPRNIWESIIARAGNAVGNIFGELKSRFGIPTGLKMPDFGMQPAMAGAYPAGARQVSYINNSKTINITNTVNVDARGNDNAKQIGEKTSQGVDMVSRRMSRATI